jgi:predicted dehydrogenase
MVKAEREVRVGILGAGAIAQVSHLPAYARIPGATVAAICDTDLPRARRVAGRYNIPHVARSIEELVELEDVEAVDICLPNHLHAPATIAALETGKHVLCEKPFSRSSKEAEQMVAVAREQGRVLMSGFNGRYREDVSVLKRFVSEGELGTVFYAKTGWLMQASEWTGPSWKGKKRYAGGGVLLDLGIQMLDAVMWLLDMPPVESVSATAHPKPHRDELETSAAALLRLKGGGTVALEVSWGLLMDKDFAYLNLFGDKGAALLNPLRVHREMHGSLVNVTPAVTAGRNSYKLSYEAELRHFVECARTGARSRSPGEDALVLHRILEAVYQSALEGREIRLG